LLGTGVLSTLPALNKAFFISQVYYFNKARVENINRVWYLYSGQPDPFSYIYSVYKIIFYSFDNGLENAESVASLL
jgi:hypothetical protein